MPTKLTGKQWMKNTISIWDEPTKSREEKRLAHPAIFPAAFAQRIIECFDQGQIETIADPFAGIGSTLVAAKQMGINAIGTELNAQYAQIGNERISQILPFNGNADCFIHTEDARNIHELVPYHTVDFVLTSPPYWDILLEKRTVFSNQKKNYGEAKSDLGKIRDYDNFLCELQAVCWSINKILKTNTKAIVIVMDLRKGKKFYNFHGDMINLMELQAFVLEDIIIWNRQSDYHALKPVGYPSVFYANKVHEYILIFRKESEA